MAGDACRQARALVFGLAISTLTACGGGSGVSAPVGGAPSPAPPTPADPGTPPLPPPVSPTPTPDARTAPRTAPRVHTTEQHAGGRSERRCAQRVVRWHVQQRVGANNGQLFGGADIRSPWQRNPHSVKSEWRAAAAFRVGRCLTRSKQVYGQASTVDCRRFRSDTRQSDLPHIHDCRPEVGRDCS